LSDLEECYQELNENSLDKLSDTEKESAIKLIEICKHIANNFTSKI
jgi:hypothetical protein